MRPLPAAVRTLLDEPVDAHVATLRADGAPRCAPARAWIEGGRVALAPAAPLGCGAALAISLAGAGAPPSLVVLVGRVAERRAGEAVIVDVEQVLAPAAPAIAVPA